MNTFTTAPLWSVVVFFYSLTIKQKEGRRRLLNDVKRGDADYIESLFLGGTNRDEDSK